MKEIVSTLVTVYSFSAFDIINSEPRQIDDRGLTCTGVDLRGLAAWLLGILQSQMPFEEFHVCFEDFEEG